MTTTIDADSVVTSDGAALLRAMRQWTREQIGAFRAGLAARRAGSGRLPPRHREEWWLGWRYGTEFLRQR
jgi:hypothetical protein